MTKGEDQIAKDKEAVLKMVGAKSAMEAALRRIDDLTNALKAVGRLHQEAAKVLSPDARVKTRYAGLYGAYIQDEKVVLVDDITANIASIVSKNT